MQQEDSQNFDRFFVKSMMHHTQNKKKAINFYYLRGLTKRPAIKNQQQSLFENFVNKIWFCNKQPENTSKEKDVTLSAQLLKNLKEDLNNQSIRQHSIAEQGLATPSSFYNQTVQSYKKTRRIKTEYNQKQKQSFCYQVINSHIQNYNSCLSKQKAKQTKNKAKPGIKFLQLSQQIKKEQQQADAQDAEQKSQGAIHTLRKNRQRCKTVK